MFLTLYAMYENDTLVNKNLLLQYHLTEAIAAILSHI